jgi:hypothetical protein
VFSLVAFVLLRSPLKWNVIVSYALSSARFISPLNSEGPFLNGAHRAEHPDYEPDFKFQEATAETDAEQPLLI